MKTPLILLFIFLHNLHIVVVYGASALTDIISTMEESILQAERGFCSLIFVGNMSAPSKEFESRTSYIIRYVILKIAKMAKNISASICQLIVEHEGLGLDLLVRKVR